MTGPTDSASAPEINARLNSPQISTLVWAGLREQCVREFTDLMLMHGYDWEDVKVHITAALRALERAEASYDKRMAG
jgi:hypothetical protein